MKGTAREAYAIMLEALDEHEKRIEALERAPRCTCGAIQRVSWLARFLAWLRRR